MNNVVFRKSLLRTIRYITIFQWLIVVESIPKGQKHISEKKETQTHVQLSLKTLDTRQSRLCNLSACHFGTLLPKQDSPCNISVSATEDALKPFEAHYIYRHIYIKKVRNMPNIISCTDVHSTT